MGDLTQAQVRELLTYDPETGWLKWHIHKRGRRPGRAGSLNPKGHRHIKIGGKYRLEHRVIWLLIHGRFPTHQIDHINRIKDDNRLVNLREATASQNTINSARTKNRSGFRGVYRIPRNLVKPYEARLRVNNRAIHLGCFQTAEAASGEVIQAVRRIFGEFIDPALWTYK